MDRHVVLEGRLSCGEYADNWRVLKLGDEPLALLFSEALVEKKKQVSVRYFISSEPLTEEQRVDAEIRLAVGEGYAEYIDHYSDITGYLWTDEELTVGGHDLKTEMESHVGKWCRMELTIHETD